MTTIYLFYDFSYAGDEYSTLKKEYNSRTNEFFEKNSVILKLETYSSNNRVKFLKCKAIIGYF